MQGFLRKYIDCLALAGVLLLNGALWSQSSHRVPLWSNVPPAPSLSSTLVAFLGDGEMAYRSVALTLQNFGNTTGQVQALKDYDYENLGTWFDLGDRLNSRSNYVPFLAAYYYGANQDPSRLMPVITYLRRVGTYDYPEKWRYLGQAVYLARHKMNDMQLALSLADDLGKTYKPGMPAWPLQMKAIIASGMGDKEMAYNLMLDALQTKGQDMDPAEIFYMRDEICNKFLSPDKRRENPVCQGLK